MRCSEDDLRAYRLLFEIESYLRLIVRWELRASTGRTWKGAIPEAILKDASQRKRQEQDLGYLDAQRTAILSYLNLTELKDILLDSIWNMSSFAKWASQDLIRADFKKLCGVRNKVAHFRPVTSRDSRVIRNFAEDLSDWTRIYRSKREYAQRMTFDSSAGEFLERKKLGEVYDVWREAVAGGAIDKRQVSVQLVLGHIVVEAEAMGGSIRLDALKEYVASNEKDLTFVRLGEQAKRICIYMPISVGQGPISECFQRLLLLLTDIGQPRASDEIFSEVGAGVNENVLAWQVKMPDSFKYSG